MPRLRNVLTDAVVSVSDDKAKRMGKEWQPAEKSVEPKKSQPKKAASSKSEK